MNDAEINFGPRVARREAELQCDRAMNDAEIMAPGAPSSAAAVLQCDRAMNDAEIGVVDGERWGQGDASM